MAKLNPAGELCFEIGFNHANLKGDTVANDSPGCVMIMHKCFIFLLLEVTVQPFNNFVGSFKLESERKTAMKITFIGVGDMGESDRDRIWPRLVMMS